MVFKKKSEGPSDSEGALRDAVRAELPGNADEATERIVTAVAGLLGCVAYADREYSESEEVKVREELGRIQGLSSEGVEAVCQVLRQHIQRIAIGGDQLWTRELKELGDTDLRVEVLEVLLDLAAADEDLSLSETNYLRRVALGLGLPQGQYEALQARHRDKLSVLK